MLVCIHNGALDFRAAYVDVEFRLDLTLWLLVLDNALALPISRAEDIDLYFGLSSSLNS